MCNNDKPHVVSTRTTRALRGAGTGLDRTCYFWRPRGAPTGPQPVRCARCLCAQSVGHMWSLSRIPAMALPARVPGARVRAPRSGFAARAGPRAGARRRFHTHASPAPPPAPRAPRPSPFRASPVSRTRTRYTALPATSDGGRRTVLSTEKEPRGEARLKGPNPFHSSVTSDLTGY